ncbi:MAG: hypothetical protein J0I19_12390 [Alphaproteobacteria bacterium]|nr:hypothetical protein [Alphaproteobacteria bacterium]
MKHIHMPRVDARYWASITMASIFGTNLGDFYAHESGLGIVPGVAILAALAGMAFLAERRDQGSHEFYYWLVIIIIRTGATNIADYLAFAVHIPAIPLSIALGAGIAVLAAWMAMTESKAEIEANRGLPATDGKYWVAMLFAGVFGTVLGDVCSHYYTEAHAAIGLGLLLAVILLGRWQGIVAAIPGYWLTVSVARTAGTAMGDWLAENKIFDIGLTVSTFITGLVFVGILVMWRSGTRQMAPASSG